MELAYRIEQAEYLRGQMFVRKAWRPRSHNPDWDHDHCSACWVRIWDRPQDDGDSLSEGYASVAFAKFADDYHWLCSQCFADLRDVLDLKELEANP